MPTKHLLRTSPAPTTTAPLPRHAHTPPEQETLRALQSRLGNRGMQQWLQAYPTPASHQEIPPTPNPHAEAECLAHAGVRNRLGAGSPLPEPLREEAEQRFNTRFTDVRVHDHPAAHALAQRHFARAFTIRDDIVFNSGHYQPGNMEGKRLLAHELAHVVQQRGGAHSGIRAGHAHEAAADAAAQASVQGARHIYAGPPAAVGMQCEPLSLEEISRLDLQQARARLLANERESEPLMLSEKYRERLALENILLKARLKELNKPQTFIGPLGKPAPPGPAQAPVPADPEVIAAMVKVRTEMEEVRPLVMKYSIDVTLNPKDIALNTVRGISGRLASDRQFMAQLLPVAGPLRSEAQNADELFAEWQDLITPAVKQAERWHKDNPAGKSLGMLNEEAGVWLVTKGSEHIDKGGWYYVSGGAAYVAAFGVAFVDAGEQMFSFGFHDAATAVSQAYTNGDISWNEGEEILRKAAWRALLTAAITRGAGMVASRLGTGAATALKIAPQTLKFGAVAGSVTGGLTTVATLGSQTIITRNLQDGINSPAGKAIWNQGIPSGKEWAIAIPLGIVLGGLGGAKAVQFGNEKLIGSVIDTPSGPCRVIAVTKGGQVVLEPVGGLRPPPPPPPASEITMIYDPVSNAWVMPKGSPTSLVPVPPATKANVSMAKPAAKVVKPTAPLAQPKPKPLAPPLKKLPALPEAEEAGLKPVEEAEPKVAPKAEEAASAKAEEQTGKSPELEIKPAETAPPDIKPSEVKAPEAKPPQAKAAELKPPETKTADINPVETNKPATAPVAKSPRVLAAEKRVMDTRAALNAAQKETAAAQTGLATAQSELLAARQLAAAEPKDPVAKALLKEAQDGVRKAQARLAAAAESEGVARTEAEAVARGREEVAKLEAKIATLDKQITAELHPPGGFTPKQIQEGRRPGMIPRAPSVEPSGAKYHELDAKRNAALAKLKDETEGLTRSLAEQVKAATPGKAARPIALANAAKLDPLLHPVNDVPIDVTTGSPMTTDSWATDHLMARTEIARDPRFARLTPMQRDAMLHDIPENFLPMTGEANSSKGALSVSEWLAAREASGQPIPPKIADALRAADVLARKAVEARFRLFLGE